MGLFGIKTKKDKQIEQLKREVEWLKGHNIEPIIVTNNYKPIVLCARYELPLEEAEIVPREIIKTVLSRELSKELEKYMEMYEETDYCRCQKMYMARVNIIEKKEN